MGACHAEQIEITRGSFVFGALSCRPAFHFRDTPYTTTLHYTLHASDFRVVFKTREGFLRRRGCCSW